MQRFKASRIAKAPFVKTGDAAARGTAAAGEKGAISTEGAVHCAQPLLSPVTGTPCLFWSVKVVAEWKDGDTKKEKVLQEEKSAADFSLDDGSGPISVDVSAGDIDLEQTFDKTQAPGIVAGIAGGELTFGNFKLALGVLKLGTKYRVVEKVLKPQPKFFVCGRMDDSKTIRSPKWTSLILSPKSRDELFGSTLKAAKGFLIGGAAAAAAGLVLGVVSIATAKPHEKKPAPVAAVAPSTSPKLSAAQCTALSDHFVNLAVEDAVREDASLRKLSARKLAAKKAELKRDLASDNADLAKDCQNDFSAAAFNCYLKATTVAATDGCRDL
jgi:hypothetical protein